VAEEIQKARQRAANQAEEIIPRTEYESAYQRYFNLRFDLLCHQVFEQFDLQPALYESLMDKVRTLEWEMGKK
jgi:hypothetical protein